MYHSTIPSLADREQLKELGPPAFGESKNTIKEPSERYTPEAVEKHRKMDEDEYNERHGKSVKRHYIQEEALADRQAIKTVLQRHNIPTEGQTWLVYAGFTGELADALSKFGNDVIFTDPLETWITEAEDRYHRTEQTTLQSLPSSLIAGSDGLIMFEGFGPMTHEVEASIELLRALTTQHGFTFFESEYTRNCTISTGSGKTLKGKLNAFTGEKYGSEVQSQYRERHGLRAYNLRARSEQIRTQVLRDLWIIYAIVDSYLSGDESLNIDSFSATVTIEFAEKLADDLNTSPLRIKNTVDRLAKIQHQMLTPNEQTYNRRGACHVPVRSSNVTIFNHRRFQQKPTEVFQ